MGRGRLSRKEVSALAAAILIACGLLRCGDDGEAAPSATAPPPPTATASATVPPSPTATPDILGPRPGTPHDAVLGVARYEAAGGAVCGEAFAAAWLAAPCVSADFDGDGATDTAMLLRLDNSQGRGPQSGAVLVQFGKSGPFAAFLDEPFPATGPADASDAGAKFFAGVDRTGDARPDITFLATTCGASNCSTTTMIESWDGTAWRNAGPALGFMNPDQVQFKGTGGSSTLTVHAGQLQTVGAGPTRATTSVFALSGGHYELASAITDAPVYLYHAIRDADAKFSAGDFPGAIDAYRAALANPKLKDWQAETSRGDGRTRLTGYALFRIAVATAASGADAAVTRDAFDASITGAKEPEFEGATEAFRRGFQDRGTVSAGCQDATAYLATPPIPDTLKDVFDYGYGNEPRPSYLDMCPL